jgi:hypothetical protein
MDLMELLVEPRSVKSSVTEVEHQIFAEDHEHNLDKIHWPRKVNIRSKVRSYLQRREISERILESKTIDVENYDSECSTNYDVVEGNQLNGFDHLLSELFRLSHPRPWKVVVLELLQEWGVQLVNTHVGEIQSRVDCVTNTDDCNVDEHLWIVE